MKKFSQSRVAKLATRIIDVRAWFDWDRTKAYTLALVDGFRYFFVPQKKKRPESFEKAAVEFHLNEDQIQIQQNSLYRLSILMLVCAFLIFVYALYQLFWGSIIALIVSMVIVFIALTLAFRYHFWFYQMKQRKLGCTFKEWYRHGLLGEKK